MKPTRIRRIAASLTIGAAALTSSLLTTSAAHADTTLPADGTTVTGPAGDTWWGSHPATTAADGTPGEDNRAAAPADTWWG